MVTWIYEINPYRHHKIVMCIRYSCDLNSAGGDGRPIHEIEQVHGEFTFEIRNKFTDARARCGVIISEPPPELLPFGYVDVMSAYDGCPSDYEQLSGDLNEGAGEAYVYFCGKTGKNIKMVTDVEIVGGPAGADCPIGYTKDHADLNEGAGGWYVFLCKKIDSVVNGTTRPLTSLYTYASRDFGNQCAIDHSWIDFDLNVGAGGRFIYACKK